jgi:hypothetical protein
VNDGCAVATSSSRRAGRERTGGKRFLGSTSRVTRAFHKQSAPLPLPLSSLLPSPLLSRLSPTFCHSSLPILSSRLVTMKPFKLIRARQPISPFLPRFCRSTFRDLDLLRLNDLDRTGFDMLQGLQTPPHSVERWSSASADSLLDHSLPLVPLCFPQEDTRRTYSTTYAVSRCSFGLRSYVLSRKSPRSCR